VRHESYIGIHGRLSCHAAAGSRTTALVGNVAFGGWGVRLSVGTASFASDASVLFKRVRRTVGNGPPVPTRSPFPVTRTAVRHHTQAERSLHDESDVVPVFLHQVFHRFRTQKATDSDAYVVVPEGDVDVDELPGRARRRRRRGSTAAVADG
jgi:hypothetical protein